MRHVSASSFRHAATCAFPSRGGLLLLVCLLAAVPGLLSARSMLQVADLVSHPEQYNRQVVVVVGQVADLQTATNRRGKSFYGFLLKDTNGAVKVIGKGKTLVQNGENIVVEGKFSRLRRTGRAIIYNEIQARRILSLDRFSPELIG